LKQTKQFCLEHTYIHDTYFAAGETWNEVFQAA